MVTCFGICVSSADHHECVCVRVRARALVRENLAVCMNFNIRYLNYVSQCSKVLKMLTTVRWSVW